MSNLEAHARVLREKVSAQTLLGISTSLKPSSRGMQSASRAILELALKQVELAYPHVELLDLQYFHLPLFDGRSLQESDELPLRTISDCVSRSGGLLMSVPAYWNGVSGVFKNLVDCLCGPAYDMEPGYRTALSGKLIGLLIVGADESSARAAASQAPEILTSAGARILDQPIVVSDPRRHQGEVAPALARLVVLAGELAKQIVIGVAD